MFQVQNEFDKADEVLRIIENEYDLDLIFREISIELNRRLLDKSVDIDLLEEKIKKLDKDNSYYIYCRTGVRSANSCALMNELGFKKTYNLVGGIVEWKGKLISL